MNIQKSFRDPSGETGAGKLYLVATPIGNLEDITFRAVRTMKEVQWIAAEDTRQTRKLLTHFDIATRLVSYHEHNKKSSGPELIRHILNGDSIALVSDAGMPAISDPGYDLVLLAIENGISVIPVPGANAALSALIMSGLPTEQFTFVGFLPRERKEILKQLEQLRPSRATMLFYESPHRLEKTIAYMAEAWGGERPVALVRELTKRYEEAVRGSLQECIEYLKTAPPQGEYCIVAGGLPEGEETGGEASQLSALEPEEHVSHYEQLGLSRKDALKQAALDRGVPKRDLYNLLQRK